MDDEQRKAGGQAGNSVSFESNGPPTLFMQRTTNPNKRRKMNVKVNTNAYHAIELVSATDSTGNTK
jgi:hypothetical protein